jgi:hypothetical protein
MSRRRTDQHGFGAALEDPFELLDRLLDDREGDHRSRENLPLVVELPLLVHPLVEGVDRHVSEIRIVPEPFLDEACEGRVHHRPVDAELGHELEPWRRLAEGGDRSDGLAPDLPVALALRVAVLEVLLLGARSRHDVERGVGDVVADLAADHDLRPAVDIDVVDNAFIARWQVPREGLAGLVHVVISVEDGEIERSRRHGDISPLRPEPPRAEKHDSRVSLAELR